jgi:hypothetical protein
MTEAQQNISIRSVKLKRKGDEGFIPEITVHDPEMKLDKTYANCENLCHSEFTKAVKRLNHHIAVLTDKITVDNFENDTEIDEIIIARGYSLSGAETELRITLKGYQKTRRGGTFQINTPVLYLEQEDEDKAYFLVDDLKEKVKRIELEARQYIFEGKCYEDPQLSLNMPDVPDSIKKVTKAQVLPPAPPTTMEGAVGNVVDQMNGEIGKGKKGTKKKVPQSQQHPSGEAE